MIVISLVLCTVLLLATNVIALHARDARALIVGACFVFLIGPTFWVSH